MKTQIRRYNFIANHRIVYSGLFEKVGFWGGLLLRIQLIEKRDCISKKYNIPKNQIIISNTIK